MSVDVLTQEQIDALLADVGGYAPAAHRRGHAGFREVQLHALAYADALSETHVPHPPFTGLITYIV